MLTPNEWLHHFEVHQLWDIDGDTVEDIIKAAQEEALAEGTRRGLERASAACADAFQAAQESYGAAESVGAAMVRPKEVRAMIDPRCPDCAEPMDYICPRGHGVSSFPIEGAQQEIDEHAVLADELAEALRRNLKTMHWVLTTVPKDHWWLGEYQDLGEAQAAEEKAREVLARFEELKK
jgi:hypothetical protein